VRLNLNFFATNYVVCGAVIALALSLRHPAVLLGLLFAFAAGVSRSAHWVSVVVPWVKAASGKTVSAFLDPKSGQRFILVTEPSRERSAGNRLISVSEERIIKQLDATKVSVFCTLLSMYMLFSSPVRALITFMLWAAVSSAWNITHASLLKPTLGSSFVGLGSARTRSELDQNIRTLWDIMRGNSNRT